MPFARMEPSFDDFLEKVLAVSQAVSDDLPIQLTSSDFLLSTPMTRKEVDSVLTKGNKTRADNYRQKFQDKGIQIADLQQNPDQRPRWGNENFPTLTRGCTKMMHLPTGQIYSEALIF